MVNYTNYKRMKQAGLASLEVTRNRIYLVRANFDAGMGIRGADRKEPVTLAEVNTLITALNNQLADLNQLKTDIEAL